MGKREYIKPTVQVEEVEATYMICASIGISDEEIDTGGRTQGRRGSWGNLWDE